MEQSINSKAPFFSPAELRQELTDLWTEHHGNESKLRSELLTKLSALKKHAHQQAEQSLLSDGDGKACAQSLSHFQDELIRILYDYTTTHIYQAINPTSAERISIIATGGYGRGALAPSSDIDLLFLLPYKQTAWGESVIEFMLYLLWDLGFKVGHASRSIEQSIRYAQEDMTIRTAMIDSRFIWGEKTLYDDFIKEFKDKVIKGTEREFIEAKLEERDERHERSGASRYMVEPNIKDGKGGQRDLHTLHWIAQYLTLQHDEERGILSSGIFTEEEFHSFKHCEEFLWTVRCHLHFLTGRPEERITFDQQKPMAERLGYRQSEGMQAVERFMKHYFLTAKEVGNLTRTLCADLEMKQLKSTPKLNQFLETLGWQQRSTLRNSSDFKIENGRLNIAHNDTFKHDPVNLIRIFKVANQYNSMLHPMALRQMRAALRLIDDIRTNPTANSLFLELLTSKNHPENALRAMNESGVLGRFIPQFGQIVSMMQFNMYHHFTVDEHLIRTVGELAWIDRGEAKDPLPLSHDIMPTLENRKILYVTAFLHDIAKGRKEDHSIAGAREARELCPQLGLSPAETDTVAWLIEEHLTMSQFAQARDLNDPQTIKDFASRVQSLERLKLLLILTVCDIRAVGPGTWNGWKGQLLRSLYYQTEMLLSGGHSQESHKEQITKCIDQFSNELDGWTEKQIKAYTARHFPAYWLRTDLATQISHANLVKTAEEEGNPLAFEVASDAFTANTNITIYTQAHPKLLSLIAGSCAAKGANIIDAQVTTTQDGMALDTVIIKREFDSAEDENRRARTIIETLEKVIRGKIHPDKLMPTKPNWKGRINAFEVPPDVRIDNAVSNDLTVIEVRGIDRPGLLFELTRQIGDLNLDISSAHIATYGEKAVDVFYVTDLTGGKITNEQRQHQIKTRLLQTLEGDEQE